MKRSDLFIRLMTGIIFLAVAIYGGVVLYDTVANPYETAIAVSYTVEETFPAQGYIVRTETILSDFSAAVLPIVREGEKVASGQAIAIEYFNRDALETAAEIRALTMKIAGLEAYGGINEQARREIVTSLSEAVHAGDLRRLDEITMDIEANIFFAETDVQVLKDRLEELQGRSINARTVYAPLSGNFSHVVDGFEHITPDMIEDMLPSDFQAHFRTPLEVTGAGKLVTGFRWYYVAEMNYDEAIRLTAGETKVVQFSGTYQAHVEMLVESVGKRSGDACVVLFSSTSGIQDVASLRFLRAVVINDVVTGVRIPREAVRLEDRDGVITEYVYLQTSGYAERVDIERIPAGNPYESSDSYLVRDGTETGSPLRVGSIIIVKANDLYHGKVVG